MFNLNSEYLTEISLEEDDNISRYLPERSLLRSVLYRAVLDLTDRDPRIRVGSFFWFLFNDSKDWGSYLHICNVLGIENTTALRDGIFKSLKDKITKLEVEDSNNGKHNHTRSKLLRYIENITP